MALDVIGEALLRSLVDFAVGHLGKRISLGGKGTVSVDTTAAQAAITQHLVALGRWAFEISFRDLHQSKSLSESFVNLDLHVGPFRSTSQAGEASLHVTDLIDIPGHVVLLGDPGAGKTTSLKRLAQLALQRSENANTAFIPLGLRLRELGETDSLSESLLQLLGGSIKFSDSVDSKARPKHRLGVVAELLERFCGVLLLDGLDELHPGARDQVVSEFRDLCLQLRKTRVLLTCRTGDFRYHIERAATLTINPLTEEQIREFAIRWLGHERAPDFLLKVRSNPYSGSEVRPLTLAHLCAIYERSGTVPDKPRTIYRKVVRLLLEEWDEQRSVRRYSRYAGFEVDRKEDFLEALAFYISLNFQTVSFTDSQLRNAYLAIHEGFGLPGGEAEKVVREIESHTGLIVEVAHDEFEFAHKSLQEYLAASFLLKLPTIPSETVIQLPNEAALAVALSSSPTSYFLAVVHGVEPRSYVELPSFTDPFLRRLLIEKVDFLTWEEVGLATLALFARTYYPDRSGQLVLPFQSSTTTFLDFLSQPTVQTAVASVLQESSVTVLAGELFSVMPQRQYSRFSVGVGRRLTVDRTFLLTALKDRVPPHVQRALSRKRTRKGTADT